MHPGAPDAGLQAIGPRGCVSGRSRITHAPWPSQAWKRGAIGKPFRGPPMANHSMLWSPESNGYPTSSLITVGEDPILIQGWGGWLHWAAAILPKLATRDRKIITKRCLHFDSPLHMLCIRYQSEWNTRRAVFLEFPLILVPTSNQMIGTPYQSTTVCKSIRLLPRLSYRDLQIGGAVHCNPGEYPDQGMHLTPETPTYSMRGCGGLPADAGGV